jgi:hypothetical protein
MAEGPTYSEEHPHEPEIPRLLDAEGRCFFCALDVRLDRIEKAISTMASWLVQAQTGFGEQDARGIDDILKKE